MNIRKMTKKDVQAVYQMSTACFSVPWSQEALQEEVGKLYLVAELKGQLVGYIGLRQILDEGEIMNVAVSPEFRRQGIGEALLKQLIEEAKACHICTIFLEVRESNDKARKLYEKFNFRTYDKRKAYYSKPVEDALLYFKKI